MRNKGGFFLSCGKFKYESDGIGSRKHRIEVVHDLYIFSRSTRVSCFVHDDMVTGGPLRISQ